MQVAPVETVVRLVVEFPKTPLALELAGGRVALEFPKTPPTVQLQVPRMPALDVTFPKMPALDVTFPKEPVQVEVSHQFPASRARRR